MAVTALESLHALPEWVAYSAMPGQDTFQHLLRAANGAEARLHVLEALARRFAVDRYWRVAQHLAIECSIRKYPGLGLYYGRLALELSGGDVAARLALIRCLWDQRFCEPALWHADIARIQLRRLRPAARRQRLQVELADLSANLHVYVHNTRRALTWLSRRLRFQPYDADTLRLALAATISDHFPREAARLALLLSPVASKLSGRSRGYVAHVLRRRFLSVLSARAVRVIR